MNDQSVRIGAWFSVGWMAFKRNWKWLVGAQVVITAAKAMFAFDTGMGGQRALGSAAVSLAMTALWALVNVGFLKACLKSVREEAIEPFDFIAGFTMGASPIVAAVLFFAGIFFGIVLLVVPGVIFALRYQLWEFALIDWEASGAAAMKRSAAITKGHVLKLLLAATVTIIPFGVTFIVSWFGVSMPEGIKKSTLPYIFIPIVAWTSCVLAATYENLRIAYEPPPFLEDVEVEEIED